MHNESLPTDILAEFLSHADIRTVLSCSLVSRTMRDLTDKILFSDVVLRRDLAQLPQFLFALNSQPHNASRVQSLTISLEETLIVNKRHLGSLCPRELQTCLASIFYILSPGLRELNLHGTGRKSFSFSFQNFNPSVKKAIFDCIRDATRLQRVTYSHIVFMGEDFIPCLGKSCMNFCRVDLSSDPRPEHMQNDLQPSLSSMTELHMTTNLTSRFTNAFSKLIDLPYFEQNNKLITVQLYGPFKKTLVGSLLRRTQTNLKSFSWFDIGGADRVDFREAYRLESLALGFKPTFGWAGTPTDSAIFALDSIASRPGQKKIKNFHLKVFATITGSETCLKVGKALDTTFDSSTFPDLVQVRLTLMVELRREKGDHDSVQTRLASEARGAAPQLCERGIFDVEVERWPS